MGIDFYGSVLGSVVIPKEKLFDAAIAVAKIVDEDLVEVLSKQPSEAMNLLKAQFSEFCGYGCGQRDCNPQDDDEAFVLDAFEGPFRHFDFLEERFHAIAPFVNAGAEIRFSNSCDDSQFRVRFDGTECHVEERGEYYPGDDLDRAFEFVKFLHKTLKEGAVAHRTFPQEIFSMLEDRKSVV